MNEEAIPQSEPSEKIDDRAYQAIAATRQFEISLLWKRSNAFWIFTAGAFVAFYETYKPLSTFPVVISNIGFFCTFCWTLANRGSKFWQENWENWMAAINEPKKYFSGNRDDIRIGFFTYRFSVSKLLIICSDYMTVLWFLIIVGLGCKGNISFCSSHWYTGFGTIGTLLYSAYILISKWYAKGKDW